MAGQLRYLAEIAGLANVSVRVVPSSAGYHPGLVTGAFTVLRFPPNGGGGDSEPPTIYQEIYTGALYLDKPAEVERFDAAFGTIWDAALSEGATARFIARTAEDMSNG
jgi:hypothetical protein